jgi:hypothetical protein
MQPMCGHLNLQVSSTMQIFSALSLALSVVDSEYLTLCHGDFLSSDWYRVARIQLRELFKSFSNVKTLSVDGTLVGELFRSLKTDYGEPPSSHSQCTPDWGTRSKWQTLSQYLE